MINRRIITNWFSPHRDLIFLWKTSSIQMLYNIMQSRDNFSWTCLGSKKVLILDLWCQSFHFLFLCLYLWNKPLSSLTRPACCKLRTEWCLRTKSVLSSTVWLKDKSCQILTQYGGLLAIRVVDGDFFFLRAGQRPVTYGQSCRTWRGEEWLTGGTMLNLSSRTLELFKEFTSAFCKDLTIPSKLL